MTTLDELKKKKLEELEKREFRLYDCDFCDGLGRYKFDLTKTAPTSELCPKCKGYGTEEKGRQELKAFLLTTIDQTAKETLEAVKVNKPIFQEFIQATPIWLDALSKMENKQCFICGCRADKMKELHQALADTFMGKKEVV